MKRIKVLNGYTAHARFLVDVCVGRVGWIARKRLPVKTPYSFGPSCAVMKHSDKGPVVIAETAHRRYEVWAIPAEIIRATDEQATQENLTL